jgi:hypothetical protein
MTADRAIRLVLGTWASAVLGALWIGLLVDTAGGGHLAADGWRTLSSLALPAQIVSWVLFLPVAVGLWASQADLSAVAGVAVLLGLVLWTAVAWTGLARTLVAARA